LVASGRSSRWTGQGRPGGLGLPPTSRSPARRHASARTLSTELESQELHGPPPLSTPSGLSTALSAIGTQLVEISALLSHLGLAEHDSALRGAIRRRMIHSPDALAHLLTSTNGWHGEVGMRTFQLGRFVHSYQQVGTQLARCHTPGTAWQAYVSITIVVLSMVAIGLHGRASARNVGSGMHTLRSSTSDGEASRDRLAPSRTAN
jgi:hypothetical protein